MKDSISGRFLRNSVRGSLVKVRGGSVRNLFEDNDLVDSGYFFAAAAAAAEGEASGIPSLNRVVGGSVRESKVCFRFRGAHDNSVADVQVDSCELRKDGPGGGSEASRNHLSGVDVGQAGR